MRLTVLDKTTNLNSTVNKLKRFQQRGLLNYQIQKPRRSSGFGTVSVGGNSKTVTAELTNEGEKYIISKKKGDYLLRYYLVKASELSFGEITDIKVYKEFNLAEVNYTLIRKTTPFGKDLNQTIKKTEKFTKYNDGWKIKN